MPLTFADFFAGCGGIRLGFQAAGFSCAFANDVDKYCAETYRANFSPDVFVLGDIKGIDFANDIPNFDVLCGGFPCQPFSNQGVVKKRAMGLSHGFLDQTKGTLFFHLLRALEERRPQAFFFENVPNFLSHCNGQTFATARAAINSVGYSLFHSVINPVSIVPQHRPRLFMVGFSDRAIGFAFPRIPPKKTQLADILDPCPENKYTLTEHMWQYLQAYRKKHRLSGHGFGFSLANPSGASRTLMARYHKDGAEILIAQPGKPPRRLTPRECARLQGFPDSFQIPVSDTQAYQQLGNSVVVPLVAAIAKQIALSLMTRPPRPFGARRQSSLGQFFRGEIPDAK